MRLLFVAVLMFSSATFTTVFTTTVFAWPQAPTGCFDGNLHELFYNYELLSFKLDSETAPKNINIELEVTHYICERKKEAGEWTYYWELVGDKTFTIRTSNGVRGIGDFRYKKTDVKYFYKSVIQVPVETMLSTYELRDLKEGKTLSLDKNLYFKHHSNFGWTPWSFYILNFKLNLDPKSNSVALIKWSVAGRK